VLRRERSGCRPRRRAPTNECAATFWTKDEGGRAQVRLQCESSPSNLRGNVSSRIRVGHHRQRRPANCGQGVGIEMRNDPRSLVNVQQHRTAHPGAVPELCHQSPPPDR
jgi:hypothetical protein